MFHLSSIQQTELIRTCCEQRLHNSSADFGVIQEALAGCCSWKSSDINVVLHAKWYAVQCAPQLLWQSLQLPADHTCKVRLHFILPSSSRNAISGQGIQTYILTASGCMQPCSIASQNLGDRQGEAINTSNYLRLERSRTVHEPVNHPWMTG